MKEFSKFLSLFGIDFEKYKNHEIVNKKGEKYKFSQLDKKRIAEFDWAYVLAEHNELLVFDYRENIDTLSAKINAFQNGRIKNICSWYKNDAERLRLAKNIGYFLRDVDGRVQLEKDQMMIYFDNQNVDTYILAVTSAGRNSNLIKAQNKGGNLIWGYRKAGQELGINAIAAGHFPYVLVKALTPENCNNPEVQINGLTYQKSMIYEERNDEAIKIAEQNEIEKQKKIMSKKFSDKEDNAAKEIALKTFETGDSSLCEGEPILRKKVIEAYKIVLLNKIGDVDDLRSENVEGSLWSWFNEDGADSTVQEIVFFIRDRVEDYK